jgi:hypothetical protein
MKKLIFSAALVFALGGGAMAQAATPMLFGGAMLQSGSVSLVSNTGDATTSNDFSGIELQVASGTTFSTLSTLSADFNVTDDNCLAGSPRFQITVNTSSSTATTTTLKNIFAYIGPEPSYDNCTQNTWSSSTNLLSGARFLDTSQLSGGTFYDTYAHALSAYGSYPVMDVKLVVDSGWAFSDQEQTVLIDNVMLNNELFTFSTATGTTTPNQAKHDNMDKCKNGGWMDLGFKNQGQCVSAAAKTR